MKKSLTELKTEAERDVYQCEGALLLLAQLRDSIVKPAVAATEVEGVTEEEKATFAKYFAPIIDFGARGEQQLTHNLVLARGKVAVLTEALIPEVAVVEEQKLEVTTETQAAASTIV